MKLWGGRFTEAEDALTEAFNESLSFDKRMYRQDIRGSIAHAKMLGKQSIISEEDSEAIVKGLEGILSDIEAGKLTIGGSAEDIHSFIEAELTERIGEAGKRLHTGRSRNDQVALDMKMYTRDHMDSMVEEIKKLIDTFEKLIDENRDTYMPGFTHLQKAQPTTLAHHMGAYKEMLLRDLSRLSDTRDRLNECPLGAGAFAGTTYPLDRDYTAKLLEFRKPTNNSMDSVSDRDYLLEYIFDLSTIQMHLSRLSEEIIIWNSNEYQFVRISDAYSTGSSIMPQKKNPDIAELIRGKTGRVYGALQSLLVVMKGLPLAYNKDMQEDKEFAFDAMDTVLDSVKLMNGMLSTITFNKTRMEDSAKRGFTNATDVADYLVRKGVPFRTAHGIVGELVLLCEEKKCALDDLTLTDYKNICDKIDEDIYDAISLETCVKNRKTTGAPGELL
ncbi:argininosuccinate lyase [Oribacterium sp. KHPX15]|uniref:argininosuccinate lyase n=1 Tax=Oribacterium sp. KHPX15 TaxID=1855342 RepID=UPI000897999C|nr:argininosuccinate lyase [Oribacterium sp. KHPX15]SEA32520.1 argininosuccinate lyase [Oribacterium sp. KHPX15]